MTTSSVPVKCCICGQDIDPGITLYWEGKPAHAQCVENKQAESLPVTQETIDFWRMRLVEAERLLQFYRELVQKQYDVDLTLVTPTTTKEFAWKALLQAGEQLALVVKDILEKKEVPENRVQSICQQVDRALDRRLLMYDEDTDSQTDMDFEYCVQDMNEVLETYAEEDSGYLDQKLQEYQKLLKDMETCKAPGC